MCKFLNAGAFLIASESFLAMNEKNGNLPIEVEYG